MAKLLPGLGGDVTAHSAPAGTTQATATVLREDFAYFSSVSSTAGVIIPPSNEGDIFVIQNADQSNSFNLYPPAGAAINGGATNAPVLVPAASTITATCFNAMQYGVSPAAGGASGQIQYNNSGAFVGAAALAYASSGTNLTVTAQNATDVALMIKGASSQSANLQEWKDSSNVLKASINATGDIATASGYIKTVGSSLKIEQTGDTFGASSLSLGNHAGLACALFTNSGLALTDLGFYNTNATQYNIRYECRGVSSQWTTSVAGEFQFLYSSAFFAAAPGEFAFRHSTPGNPTICKVYQESTDLSNYACAILDAGKATSGVFTIGTATLGTGIGHLGKIAFVSEGVSILDYGASHTGKWTFSAPICLSTAYAAGAPTASGYLTIYDSTGTAYKVPAVAA